jgi:hypothetical protein
VSPGGTTAFLRADGAWAPPPAGLANPMTAQGDLITGGAAGVPTRLPVGPNYSMLRSGGVTPAWSTTGVVKRMELYTDTPTAVLQLEAIGGHRYELTAGGTGSAYPGSLWIWDGALGRYLLRITETGDIHLNLTGDGLRHLWLGGVDSGGAGLRQILTPNNPF